MARKRSPTPLRGAAVASSIGVVAPSGMLFCTRISLLPVDCISLMRTRAGFTRKKIKARLHYALQRIIAVLGPSHPLVRLSYIVLKMQAFFFISK
jgi:hypothetical protein